MTPLQAMMLIHYSCCADPYPNEEFPSQQAAIKLFKKLKLIKEWESCAENIHFEVSDLGRQTVMAMLSVGSLVL